MVGLATNSYAGSTCPLNQACDDALNAELKLNSDYKSQIANYSKESDLQKQVIADKDAQLASPLRNPVEVAAVSVTALLILEVLTRHLK